MPFIYREMQIWSACNYPESHWFTSASPDSPQIVDRYRYPGFDWILVAQTRLYYISYSSPYLFTVCLLLLLGEICKAVEFDPSQNKLRCTVLAALSSRAIQRHGEAMLCWLDLSASPHRAHLRNGPLFPGAAEENPTECMCIKKFHRMKARVLLQMSYILMQTIRVP